MNKAQFCRRVAYYIKDEAKAEKDYADFRKKAKSLLGRDSVSVKAISKAEGKHHHFWTGVQDRVCE